MFGFGKDKSPVEHLNQAYKVGGMPLALVVLGALCLLLPLGEEIIDSISEVVNPETSFIVGGSIVVVGALTWVFATQQKARLQIALFELMSEITRQASTSHKDGANFKVALEQITGELPKMLSLLTSAAPEQQNEQSEKKHT